MKNLIGRGLCMLERLDIKNFALIEDLHIEFEKGFNVLTGETGAGKSIILGALELLLGNKADSMSIRSGSDEAVISATVTLDEKSYLASWLKERGIKPDDSELLITRIIKSNLRGMIYVQGNAMTRSDLSFIGKELFDIHGQHEHQSLLSNDRQRRVLDNYANVKETLNIFSTSYRELEQQKEELHSLEANLVQALKEEDYLKFVVEELESSNLVADEDTILETEIATLSQHETIKENLELLYGSLKHSGSDSLASALQSCNKIAKIDPTFTPISNRLETCLIEIQDITHESRSYLNNLTFSQQRLDEIQSRLATLQRLKRKYGPSLEDVINFKEEAKTKLEAFETSDETLKELKNRIAKQEEQVNLQAKKLSLMRKEAAKKLEVLIVQNLRNLGMPHVLFTIDINEKEISVNGSDFVEFLFSANVGEKAKAIKEIASGGELSRVMLAIKSVLAEADDVQTLIFDEVDAGIGGSVAISVASLIEKLAKSRQVIAITHLASIAAKANLHLLVEKEVVGGRTFSHIRKVEQNERVRELARMLSGKSDDEVALKHANSLLIQS